MAHRDFNNNVFTDQNMVLPLASTIQKEIPQIKYATVTTHNLSQVLTVGEKQLKKNGYTVGEHFFDIFSWKFIKGNAASALPDAYSVVLTQSTAKALFGDADPMNKTIRIDDDFDAKVSAVVEDAPATSTIKFDYITTFNYSNDYIKRSMNEWQNSSWLVYVQSVPGADINLLDKRINEIKQSHDPSDKEISKYFSFPISKWRLYSDFKDGKNVGGMIEYVRLFTIIAVIILMIACVNFMNLSTARSEKRAKEVGVRKTLGSRKAELITQFFAESSLFALIAFALSIIAVVLLLPAFNALVDKQMSLGFSSPSFWLTCLVIILFTGMVAGSYPALYLSSFNPTSVLKGTFVAGKRGVIPRRILVVGQFAISIFLISATIVVYKQIQHTKNRDMGYNPDNLLMIPASRETQKNFTVIKQDLLNSGKIEAVTRTLSPITDIWWRSPSPDWKGKPANTNIIFAGLTSDVDFAKTMGIKMLEGNDFSGAPSDSAAMILNKAAVEAMGLKSPVGMQMRYGGREYAVTGVTDNVVMGSPFKPVEPMMIYFNPGAANFISLRLKPTAQLSQALPSIEAIFKKHNPSQPFEFKFADQEFAKKFFTEELISKITDIFAYLAIFISCLGLAGLASFTIEKRIREIGIRKVLGASVNQVLMLISKEFLKLVAIAFLIAVPFTWWMMSNWLSKYDFRVDITIWLFGVVGALMLLLTLAVVGLNTLGAAMRNPVKSLRAE
jgi:ABC-type antimicrobial peptide transport system permease subunit